MKSNLGPQLKYLRVVRIFDENDPDDDITKVNQEYYTFSKTSAGRQICLDFKKACQFRFSTCYKIDQDVIYIYLGLVINEAWLIDTYRLVKMKTDLNSSLIELTKINEIEKHAFINYYVSSCFKVACSNLLRNYHGQWGKLEITKNGNNLLFIKRFTIYCDNYQTATGESMFVAAEFRVR